MKEIIVNIYLLACSLIGLGYGLVLLYKNKQSLYFELMIFPIACQVFSRTYYTVLLLCYEEIPITFNVGYIGLATFFLFLFLPNIGVIDNLVDEKNKSFKKYRLIPIIIPAFELIVSLAALFLGYASLSVRIYFIIMSLLAGLAGYFNVKHLIIPDVEGGIIESIRKFNLFCVIFELFALAEVGLYCFNLSGATIVVDALLGIFYIIFLPFLNKETQKWIQ